MLNKMIDDIIVFTALTFQVWGILTGLFEAHPFLFFFFSGRSDLSSDPTLGDCLGDPTF